jgi:hypothetical protein
MKNNITRKTNKINMEYILYRDKPYHFQKTEKVLIFRGGIGLGKEK